MDRMNCWEVKQCGREPRGKHVDQMGVCPAAQSSSFDGVNRGSCGGRFCWAIAGTFCKGKAQGSYSSKIVSCLQCEFLQQVEREEKERFILTPQRAIAIREYENGI